MEAKPSPQAPEKKPYVSPKLTVYGEVRVLTQTQTSGSNEGSQGSGVQMGTCDPSLKHRVSLVGEHPLGIGLYLFDYKPEFAAAYGYGRQFGVMADEVEAVMPSAVQVNERGHKSVNLAMLGITRPVH